MALLDFISPESGLKLTGEGVTLRPPRLSDYVEWSELRRTSRAFLQPWEPTWGEDDLTRPAFRRRLSSYQRDIDAVTAADIARLGARILSPRKVATAVLGPKGAMNSPQAFEQALFG